MSLSRVSAIAFTGITWLLVGFMLLRKGLHLIMIMALPNEGSGLVSFFTPIAGNREQAGLILVLIGLFLGFMKGRMVLSKTVKRVVERIFSLPQPLKFTDIYTRKYFFLISLMISLGISLRWVPIAPDIKGVIDVAIGSALLNGAILYFRAALAARKQRSIENG